ncbi:hypothetical protein FCK90_04360 [Kocuria coralli]|uniref:Uncharacterized protein n=1 Tax=Kocuria coralli TaxID=1461025 RepID=A0A5J5L130_9MICC|nr:hypothetical protein [Kocuria coralli]KAA9394776.1 hypothetical protein FCK90_04360 [Kocuria coralli]
MASTTDIKTGNKIGSTTKGATVGGSLAAAAGTIVGYVLVKTGLETDPEVAVILAGAVITILSGVGALVGGKLSPTSEGDAVYAQQALEEVHLLAERAAAAQATGPMEYTASPGEEPITDPITDEAPAEETAPGESVEDAWKRLGYSPGNED